MYVRGPKFFFLKEGKFTSCWLQECQSDIARRHGGAEPLTPQQTGGRKEILKLG